MSIIEPQLRTKNRGPSYQRADLDQTGVGSLIGWNALYTALLHAELASEPMELSIDGLALRENLTMDSIAVVDVIEVIVDIDRLLSLCRVDFITGGRARHLCYYGTMVGMTIKKKGSIERLTTKFDYVR